MIRSLHFNDIEEELFSFGFNQSFNARVGGWVVLSMEAIVRTLCFKLIDVGKHWQVLHRGVAFSEVFLGSLWPV